MMYLDASLRRKVTAPIRSSGVPIFPVGMREIHLSLNSGFSSKILRVLPISAHIPLTIVRGTYSAVSMYPGLIVFTRIS